MSKKDEALRVERALKLALEALREDRAWLESDAPDDIWAKNLYAITSATEALAEQPAQQEPVAWKDKIYGNLHHQDFGNSIPLYTSPQSKPWVGLTDEEKADLFEGTAPYYNEVDYADAIEAKLREKNT